MEEYFKDYDQVFQDYVTELQSLISDIDTSDASEAIIRAKVLCARVAELYYYQSQIAKSAFITEATGEYLDKQIEQRGLSPRKQATKAKGSIRFSRTTTDVVDRIIPRGTVVGTIPDSDGHIISFVTTSQAVLVAGALTVDVSAEAVDAGALGNVPSGSITEFVGTPPAGIESVTNPDPFQDGTDTEDDESLRARALEKIRNPANGGTIYDYKTWALSVAGVTSVLVLPINRGPGTLDIVIAANGIPSDSLVAEVQNYINERRPLNADPLVVKPTSRVVDVNSGITPEVGFSLEDLTPSIETAIQNYLNSISIGGVVRITGLIKAITDVEGVLDCDITVPATNIELGGTELAVKGTVTLS